LAAVGVALVDLVYQLPKEVLHTRAVLVFLFQSQVHQRHMQQVEMVIHMLRRAFSPQVLPEQVMEAARDLQVDQV
jgi:hypothetical protein